MRKSRAVIWNTLHGYRWSTSPRLPPTSAARTGRAITDNQRRHVSSAGFARAIDGGGIGGGRRGPLQRNRRVALTARAPDSKSGGWGFESLHACQIAVGTPGEGERWQENMEFLRRVQQFFREVAAEFRRVNWPSRAEVARSTVVVLAVSLSSPCSCGRWTWGCRGRWSGC